VFYCDRMSSPKWALETVQLPLDHLAPLLDQMDAVGDLPRLSGTDPCSFRVEALAISTDDLYGRAHAQPRSNTRRRPLIKHIHYSATFKIDHDGPKAKAFAPGPVINPNDAQGARSSLTG
jgi:hypothetical protein